MNSVLVYLLALKSKIKNIAMLFILLCISLSVYSQPTQAQTQKEVFKIINNKCIKCHYNKESGLLNFTQPENILYNALMIKYVVSKKTMPPWKADTSFNCFINDRRLKNEEIQAIRDWIPSKKYIEKNRKKIEKNNDIDNIKKPDLILRLPKPFKIPSTNKDIFITYLLKTNLIENKYISAIVIKPSNKKELHHARVEIDSSDFFDKRVNINGYIKTDAIESENISELSKSKPIAIYLPGLFYNKFPTGTAYPLNVKDKIILHLHYAPTPIEQEDQTEVWIYYSKTPNPKKVVFQNASLTDFSILLPADSFTTVSFKSDPLKSDFSIFALQLHMHLLGKSINLIAITPKNDTLHLLDIPNWDFNWQEYYYYKKMVTIPKGSILVTTSVFDNTNENPNNPNIPPKTTNFYGMDTKNEMMGYICLGFYNEKPTDTIEIKVSDY